MKTQSSSILIILCLNAACSSDDSSSTTENDQASIEENELQLVDYLIPSSSSSAAFADVTVVDGIEQERYEYGVNYNVGPSLTILAINEDSLTYTVSDSNIVVQELDDPSDPMTYPAVARIGETHSISDDDSIFIAEVFDSFAMQTLSTTYTYFTDVLQIDFPDENETLYFARDLGLIGYYSRTCLRNAQLVEDIPDDQCDRINQFLSGLTSSGDSATSGQGGRYPRSCAQNDATNLCA